VQIRIEDDVAADLATAVTDDMRNAADRIVARNAAAGARERADETLAFTRRVRAGDAAHVVALDQMNQAEVCEGRNERPCEALQRSRNVSGRRRDRRRLGQEEPVDPAWNACLHACTQCKEDAVVPTS